MKYQHLLRPDIADMEPYKPIVPLEVLSEQLDRPVDEIVKLDANEHLYGPPPAALKVLGQGGNYHVYPDPEARALRAKISDYAGIPADYLICGMGADDLIDLVLRATLQPGDQVIDCPPSFGMYPFSTHVNSGQLNIVPRRDDYSLDLKGIEAAIRLNPSTKVIFVCSPNNPTGNVISEEAFERLAALPVLVVLDEAYAEFAAVSGYPGYIHQVAQRDNLVVLRTFSKMAGLAGLRVGYGGFPAWLVPHLMKIKQPYNVNVAASLAAMAALDDKDWLDEKIRLIAAERERLIAELARYDFLQPYPGQANFVLCQVIGRSASDLKQTLQDDFGILVRYYDRPRLRGFIRITAGRPGDTDRLLAALDKIAGLQRDAEDHDSP